MNPTKNHVWKPALHLIFLALLLSLPCSAIKPSPSSGTLENWVKSGEFPCIIAGKFNASGGRFGGGGLSKNNNQ